MYNDLGIIFLAGGTSSRFGENKLTQKLNEIPVFLNSIKNLSPLCQYNNCVIVAAKNNLNEYSETLKKYLPGVNIPLIEGGTERFNSVHNALIYLKKKGNIEMAAIHDTARPLVSVDLMKKCIVSCRKKGSGVAAKRISDTVKRTNSKGCVVETIDRNNLWAVETPQVFKFEDIFHAYEIVIKKNIMITDDAGAMEYVGKSVYLVESKECNLKVTYKTDLDILRQY